MVSPNPDKYSIWSHLKRPDLREMDQQEQRQRKRNQCRDVGVMDETRCEMEVFSGLIPFKLANHVSPRPVIYVRYFPSLFFLENTPPARTMKHGLPSWGLKDSSGAIREAKAVRVFVLYRRRLVSEHGRSDTYSYVCMYVVFNNKKKRERM